MTNVGIPMRKILIAARSAALSVALLALLPSAALATSPETTTVPPVDAAPCNAANLKRAQVLLESGKSRGKIVLEGW